MADLKLVTTEELIEEIQSRCDCMIFLARVRDDEKSRHLKHEKGFENDILGLIDYYKQGLLVDRITDKLKEIDTDDDSEKWKE